MKALAGRGHKCDNGVGVQQNVGLGNIGESMQGASEKMLRVLQW